MNNTKALFHYLAQNCCHWALFLRMPQPKITEEDTLAAKEILDSLNDVDDDMSGDEVSVDVSLLETLEVDYKGKSNFK